MYLVQAVTYTKKDYAPPAVMDLQGIKQKSSSLPGYTRGFHDAFLNYSPSGGGNLGVSSRTPGRVLVPSKEADDTKSKDKKKKWTGWGSFFRRTTKTAAAPKKSSSEHSSDSETDTHQPVKPPKKSSQQELSRSVVKKRVAEPNLICDTLGNAIQSRERNVPWAPDVVRSNLSSSRNSLNGQEPREVVQGRPAPNGRQGQSFSSDDESLGSRQYRSQDSLASSNASRRSRTARTERYLQRKSRDPDYMQRELRMQKSASPQYLHDHTKVSYSPTASPFHKNPWAQGLPSVQAPAVLGPKPPFLGTRRDTHGSADQKLPTPPPPPPRNHITRSYLLTVSPGDNSSRPTSCSSFSQFRHDYQNLGKETPVAGNFSPKIGSRPYSTGHFSQVPLQQQHHHSPTVSSSPRTQRNWVSASPNPSYASSSSSIPPLIPAGSTASSASFSPQPLLMKKSPSPFGTKAGSSLISSSSPRSSSASSKPVQQDLTRPEMKPAALESRKDGVQGRVSFQPKRTGSLSSQSSELSIPTSKTSFEDSVKTSGSSHAPVTPSRNLTRHSMSPLQQQQHHIRDLSKLRPTTDKNLEQAICELEEIYDSLRLSDEDLLDRAERRDLPTAHQELSRGPSSCSSGSESAGRVGAGVTSDLDTMMNWSISGSFESIINPGQPRSRAPVSRRSAIPDKVGDDMAVRRLSVRPHSETKPQSILAKSGSYLLVSSAVHGNEVPVRQSDSSDPDIVLDDVVFRNVRQANSTKIVDPQPPFGIPLGPVTPAPLTDYLHATSEEKPRFLFRPMKYPDLVKDDLAYRNLRKDGGQGPSLGPPGSHVNTEKLDDILREANSKEMSEKKRPVRSLSANITDLIRKEAALPSGGLEGRNQQDDDLLDMESVIQDVIIRQRAKRSSSKETKRPEANQKSGEKVPGLAALYPKSALLEKRSSASPKKEIDETLHSLIADLVPGKNEQSHAKDEHQWEESPLFVKDGASSGVTRNGNHSETSCEGQEVQEILRNAESEKKKVTKLPNANRLLPADSSSSSKPSAPWTSKTISSESRIPIKCAGPPRCLKRSNVETQDEKSGRLRHHHRSTDRGRQEESSSNDEQEQQQSYSQFRQLKKQHKPIIQKDNSNSEDFSTSEHLLSVNYSPGAPFKRYIRRNSPNVSNAGNETCSSQHNSHGSTEDISLSKKQEAVTLRVGKSTRPDKDKSTKRKSNLNRSLTEEQVTPTSDSYEDGNKRIRARRAFDPAVSYSSAETDQNSASEAKSSGIGLRQSKPVVQLGSQNDVSTERSKSSADERKAAVLRTPDAERRTIENISEGSPRLPWRKTGGLSRVSDITARIEALSSSALQIPVRVDRPKTKTPKKVDEKSTDTSSKENDVATERECDTKSEIATLRADTQENAIQKADTFEAIIREISILKDDTQTTNTAVVPALNTDSAEVAIVKIDTQETLCMNHDTHKADTCELDTAELPVVQTEDFQTPEILDDMKKAEQTAESCDTVIPWRTKTSLQNIENIPASSDDDKQLPSSTQTKKTQEVMESAELVVSSEDSAVIQPTSLEETKEEQLSGSTENGGPTDNSLFDEDAAITDKSTKENKNLLKDDKGLSFPSSSTPPSGKNMNQNQQQSDAAKTEFNFTRKKGVFSSKSFDCAKIEGSPSSEESFPRTLTRRTCSLESIAFPAEDDKPYANVEESAAAVRELPEFDREVVRGPDDIKIKETTNEENCFFDDSSFEDSAI